MSQMTDALARLSGGVYKQARTREEIDEKLSRFFPYKLSEEAYEFYQWSGAPIGNHFPEGQDVPDGTGTFHCGLNYLLGFAGELIRFLSIEENELLYYEPDHQNYFRLYSSENSIWIIEGTETKVETSPVYEYESYKDLWFPSLTNMMLAMAEADEKVGTLFPQENYDDDDWGTEEYEEKIRNDWKTLK